MKGATARKWSYSCCLLLLFVCGCRHRLNPTLPLQELHVKDSSSDFAQTFCSVLKDEAPYGPKTPACSKYIKTKTKQAKLNSSSTAPNYRILMVGGYMSQCLKGDIAAFHDVVEHLQTVHHLDVDVAEVSAFGSSEFNAAQLRDFIQKHGDVNRPYIAFGYCKGAPDLMTALASYSNVVKPRVAALVTVSGAVYGSPLAGAGDGTIWLGNIASLLKLPDCDHADDGGVMSLSATVRKAFMDAHPDPVVPTYSLVANSSRDQTSQVLLLPWDIVSLGKYAEDSQIVAREALVPKSTYLGMALADHWAIAVPFEASNDIFYQTMVNRNHYPRAQLFEAMIRFVAQDLTVSKK